MTKILRKQPDQSGAMITGLRVVAVIGGLIVVALGWSAQSQGILWHSGHNARIGTETDTPTLSWVIYGVLLILAGIFPWKSLSQRLKR